MARFGKLAGALAAALAFTLVAAACSSDSSSESGASGASGSAQLSGELNGAGSSAQQAAMEAWIATFTASYPDLTVNYDPSGSGAGREQFVAGGVDFAGSDAALEGEELKGAEDRCGGADNVIEIPQYISPIAVIFNVPGIDSLNMTPDTIAKIFNGDITNWNDQAIAGDNSGVDLPDLAITPVHRSDESGTTENFADYLSQAAPDVWTYPVDGNWPIEGGEAAQGTSGVVDAVTNGQGTIGYADASQAGDLGTVAVGVAGEFVEYSPEAAAAIVDASTVVTGRGKYDYAYELDRTPDTAAYPIVLLSYGLACTQYDDAQTAANVQGYLSFVISTEGQQVAAENAGSAPISDALRSESQQALDAIAT
jgi:phosphate transport system substrate-binding protein